MQRGRKTRKGRRTMDEPEKSTSGNTATNEGQEGGDEDGGPDGNTATEVPTVAHHVVVKNSLVC